MQRTGLLLLSILLESFHCQEFDVGYFTHITKVAGELVGEEGLCMVIECEFFYPVGTTLGANPHGFWFKKGVANAGVLVASTDSSREVDQNTRGRFTIIGNIAMDACTLRIDDIQKEDRGTYYFRVEGLFSKDYMSDSDSAFITIRSLSKKPEISLPSMLEADVQEVIHCTSPGRCAGTTPVFTWIGAIITPNSTTSTKTPYKDSAFTYSSSFTFTPSLDDDGKNLTCLVYYPGVKMSMEKPVTLKVKKMMTMITTTLTTSTTTTTIRTTTTTTPRTTTTTTPRTTTTTIPRTTKTTKPRTTTTTKPRTTTTKPRTTTTTMPSMDTMHTTINMTTTPATPEFGGWLKSNCKQHYEGISCSCWIRSIPPPVLLWLINEEVVIGNYSNRTLKVLSDTYGHRANSTLSFRAHGWRKTNTVNIQCVNANYQGNLKIYKELDSKIIMWITCGTFLTLSFTSLASFCFGIKIKARENDNDNLDATAKEETSTTSSTTPSSTSTSSSSTKDEAAPQGVR
ncbi:sialic acid-binding Ig-like lectin 5 [Rhinatrema bivittatum]|uniref:sialic acid-binding Ig-like lectin 5 n=1 Tax=Rhinatrema bivittatum TaxID=194408 RepID=UPI001129DFAE|nr:sialic acid-binding Ig-like lectin 5 [Rhinatrema bivittatum]